MRWSPARARLAVLLIPAVLFAIKFRYLGSGDTAPAELLPIELLTRGSLTFDTPAGEPLPSWFHRTPHGVVSAYPVMPGLVNVPVFAAARSLGVDLAANRFFLSHLTAALCALVSTYFVYLILEGLFASPGQALGFALIYALCTEVWSMASRGLWQHGPALMFLSAGLYALLRAGPAADVAAGLLLGLAVLSRPTVALLVLPLAAWAAARERRRLLALGIGAAPPALLHAAYAWYYWGSPFSLAQPFGSPTNFGGDPLKGLAGILISPARGLLVFSPVFLFAMPAALRAFRAASRNDPRALLMRALTIGTLLTLAVYSCWRVWWGGDSFGYRLIAELALPLTLLVAWDWPRIRASRVGLPLFAVAAALSVFIHALGAYEYPSAFDASVAAEPGRLWDPVDTELTLRVRRIFGPLVQGADARLAPSLRPALPPDPQWWRGETRDDAMARRLDSPREGEIVRGTLRVAGRVRPSEGPVDQVLVSLNPGSRRVIARRASSDDGFEADFTPPTRLEAAAVLVEVRDARGRVGRLGPVRFLWAPAGR